VKAITVGALNSVGLMLDIPCDELVMSARGDPDNGCSLLRIARNCGGLKSAPTSSTGTH